MLCISCNHDWVKVPEQVLPSAFEQITKGGSVKSFNSSSADFKKTYILVLKCSKCGKLDKTIHTSQVFD